MDTLTTIIGMFALIIIFVFFINVFTNLLTGFSKRIGLYSFIENLMGKPENEE